MLLCNRLNIHLLLSSSYYWLEEVAGLRSCSAISPNQYKWESSVCSPNQNWDGLRNPTDKFRFWFRLFKNSIPSQSWSLGPSESNKPRPFRLFWLCVVFCSGRAELPNDNEVNRNNATGNKPDNKDGDKDGSKDKDDKESWESAAAFIRRKNRERRYRNRTIGTAEEALR